MFQTFAADLVMRVIPAISPTYHQGTIGMLAATLLIVAEEWDRAASWRVEENQRLRELFGNSAPGVKDDALRTKLVALSGTEDKDLHISALTANNSALRAALIDLHRYVESARTDDSRRIEAAIWRELVDSTERRRLSSAQF